MCGFLRIPALDRVGHDLGQRVPVVLDDVEQCLFQPAVQARRALRIALGERITAAPMSTLWSGPGGALPR